MPAARAPGESPLRLLRERPGLPFGIHLTLVCDTDEPGFRWGPVAPAAAVPALLDPVGRLHPATPDGRARLLSALPPGPTEWAVHPSLATPATRPGDGGRRVRRSDHAFLLAPRTRALLAEHGITVTDYRPLRAHWPRPTHRGTTPA
ncbi:hypothetical protein [Kitasatospora sp. NPDC056184]|uniref:hypothetical protein n=1 Tax=Kitasatospora sp. NPDC056184 TaxID=3345738 RepID=UPI0035DB6BC5